MYFLVPTVAVVVIRTVPTMPTYKTATKTQVQKFNTTHILPGQALLAHVEKGGSWMLVQLNISGGSRGIPIELQQQFKYTHTKSTVTTIPAPKF